MALYDVLTAFQAPLCGDGEQMNQRVASARVHSACERASICAEDSFSQHPEKNETLCLIEKSIMKRLLI